MTPFGIRSRLKAGFDRLLGEKPTDTSPPNWQSRPAEAPATEVRTAARPAEARPAEARPAETRPVEAPFAEPSAVAEAPAPAALSPEPPAPEASAASGVVVEIPAEVARAPMAADADTAGPAAFSYDQVQALLDDMVRPALQGDGGDITLIKVEDNNIYVKLVGSCSSCPSSIMTMKMGVEALLKEEFPMMNELVQV
jgi:Fe-S cluster biogenesis protein NfuA